MTTGTPPAAAGPTTTRRTVPLDRLISWLVAIACIVVAAIGLQVSKPETDVQTVVGAPGQAVPYGDGSVTVGQVRVGQRVEEFSMAHTTPGMFVVVPITLTAEGSSTLRLTTFQLRSGDRVYRPYSAATMSAAPGFASTDEVTFEVDPQGIDGLVLETLYTEIVFSFHQQVQVPLGITAANAQSWRDAAVDQTVEVARTSLRGLR